MANKTGSVVKISYHSGCSDDEESDESTEGYDSEVDMEDDTANHLMLPGENSEEKSSDSGGADMESLESPDVEVKDSANDNAGMGLANVMASILRKESPNKQSVILSKGQTDRQRDYKQRGKESGQTERGQKEIGSEKKKEKKPLFGAALEAALDREKRIKKKRWEEMCRVKPSITDRDTEKKLQRIATKGVVQLFNAVQKQQKSIEEKLKSVGRSEIKRDKVLKSVSKGSFLDMLKGTSHNVTAEGFNTKLKQGNVTKPTADNLEDNKPSWGILRDDFMMGAKMKDWDKQSNDSSEDDAQLPLGQEDSSDEDIS